MEKHLLQQLCRCYPQVCGMQQERQQDRGVDDELVAEQVTQQLGVEDLIGDSAEARQQEQEGQGDVRQREDAGRPSRIERSAGGRGGRERGLSSRHDRLAIQRRVGHDGEGEGQIGPVHPTTGQWPGCVDHQVRRRGQAVHVEQDQLVAMWREPPEQSADDGLGRHREKTGVFFYKVFALFRTSLDNILILYLGNIQIKSCLSKGFSA